MHTTKFRGKILNGPRKGEWVYGYYYAIPMTLNGSTEVWHEIVDSTGFILKIDPKTVGQYVGVNDKNNQEIYEDDIVKIHNKGFEFEEGDIAYVYYCARYFGFSLANREHDSEESVGNFIREGIENGIEIIGDLHDNPDLLTQ